MPTRMERYYNSETEGRRTSRNEDLYKSIYDETDYSNIEAVTSLGEANEINISKLKEMLKSREEYQKEKDIRNIVKREKKVEIPVLEEEKDRTYDIRDVLTKAKTERTDDHKSRSLKNTQYDILKNIHIDSNYEELEKENKELKELIHTITSTSMVKKVTDADLDLFEDLKSEDGTMVGNPEIEEYVNQEKEDTKELMDQSFFTSSLGINETDFQDYEEKKNARKEKTKKIFFILFIIILLAVIAFGVYYFFIRK